MSPRIAKKPSRTLAMIPLPWHDDVRLLLTFDEERLLLLVGEPGVGKTTFARHAAIEATGQEPLILSGTPEVEQADFLGGLTMDGGSTCFADGPLPRALKTGRWLVVEEFSQIPPEARSCLMELRDQQTMTNRLNKGEVISIPSEFRVIATSNNETLTCRKNAGIATVLYDGFQIYEVPGLSDAQVSAMLRHHFPTVAETRLRRVMELWNEYRDFSAKGSSGRGYLSFRAAKQLLRLLEAGMAEHRAVQIALVNKFMPADSDLFSAAKLKVGLGQSEPDATPTEDDPAY